MKKLEIQKPVKKLAKKHPEIDLIYLFGSQAEGQATSQSDLDIAVVVKDRSKVELRQLLIEFGQLGINPINLDLSVVDMNSSPLFLFQIIKKGKCLYERKKYLRPEIESYIMRRYYDTQYLRDIYSYYLDKSIKEDTYGR